MTAASTTRDVTILFCDMVGSTDLLSRHGLEISETVRRRLYDSLRDAIDASAGEEVKSLGDGLMVAFPRSPADGVSCAVAMQRAVARLNLEQPDLPLALRVGVSGGPVTPNDGDWYGTPVNVAARLCARAGAGEIYVSEAVASRLQGGPYERESVGALDLKGIPDPHPTTLLRWHAVSQIGSVPLPPAFDVDESEPFVGRAGEIALLDAAWSSVGDRCHGLTLLGEPGAGVSRLVRMVARRWTDRGTLVLHATARREDHGPLGPIADALRWYVAATPTKQLAEDLGDLATDVDLALPGLRARLGVARSLVPAVRDPAAALERIVRGAASRQRTVLIVDSVHLAPPETRALLCDLSQGGESLLVVAAGQITADRRSLPVDVLSVGGLGAEHVLALVEQSLGSADADVVDAIMAATAGNARHVGDVLRAVGALEHRGLADVRTIVEHTCPYRGLSSFSENDHTLLFGRDDVIATVVRRISERRWVTVVGASGSGKSSLVRAGVVPALRRGAYEGSQRWQIVVMTPGTDPVAQLGRALAARVDVDDDVDALVRELSADADGIDRVSRRLVDGDSRLVLVVDQFEEVFVSVDAEHRASFLDALLRCTASPGGPTTVVAVVRADLYGHLADVPGLAGAVELGHVLVGPMGEPELAQAVVEPAFVAGLRLETGLAETIVADVVGQPGALPLLSHALLETWHRRQGRTLTIAGYRDAGGVRAAIARTADTVHDGLDTDGRARLRDLFLRLVTPGEGAEDSRRRVTRSELPPPLQALIAPLVAARLVTADEHEVDVAHEALIREWPRLRTWLVDSRESLRLHRQLTMSAASWVANGHDVSELFGGARLAALDAWISTASPSLNDDESAFVAASRRQMRVRLRRRRMLVAALSTLSAVACVAALVAVVQQRRASGNARVARASATQAQVNADRASASAASEQAARTDADLRRLAFEARAVASAQPDLGMLLAVEAYRRRPDVDSLAALQASLTARPSVRRFVDLGLPEGQGQGEVAVGGDLVAVASASLSDGHVVLLHGDDLRRTGVVLDVGAPATVVVRSDGGELATATNGGQVRWWDPASGRELRSVEVAPWEKSGITRPLAYLADGTLVVAGRDGVDAVRPNSEQPTRVLELPAPVTALASDAATRTLAVGFGDLFTRQYALRLVDTTTWMPRFPELAQQADFMSIDESGRLVVASFPSDFRAVIASVDLRTGAFTVSPTPLTTMPLGVIARTDGSVVVEEISGDLAILDRDLRTTVSVPTGLGIGAPIAAGTDGDLLFAAAGRLVVLDPDGRTTLGTTASADGVPLVGTVSVSGDGSRLLVVGPQSARVLDGATLEAIGPPMAPTVVPLLGVMSMSPDGRYVGVAGIDHTEVLDVATGSPLWPAVTGGSLVSPVFSPDSSTAVVGGLDSVVRLIDTRSGAERWSTDLHAFNVAVPPEWSTDGSRIALFANGAGSVVLDAQTGRPLGGPFAGTQLTFAPDGRTGALFSGDVLSVDLATRQTTPLRGNAGLFSGAFVDASTLFGVALNGEAALIDVPSGQQIGNRIKLGDDILTDAPSLAYDRTRKLLYVGHRTGAVQRFDLDLSRWAQRACDAAGRNLTEGEWNRYLASLGAYRVTCPAR